MHLISLNRRSIIPITLLLLGVSWGLWRYAQIETQQLIALQATNGRVRWVAYLASGVENRNRVFAANGQVIVAINDQQTADEATSSRLVAFDSQTGQQQWAFVAKTVTSLSWQAIEIVLALEPNNVYALLQLENTRMARLFVFDRHTGQTKWHVDLWREGDIETIGVAEAGQQLFIYRVYEDEQQELKYTVQSLDLNTGGIIWEHDLAFDEKTSRMADEPSLSVGQDRVFFSLSGKVEIGQLGDIVVLDRDTGQQLTTIEGETQQLLTQDSNLLQLTRNDFTNLDLVSGIEQWTASSDQLCPRGQFDNAGTEAQTAYLICNAGGQLFEPSHGSLVALTVSNGIPRWTARAIFPDYGLATLPDYVFVGARRQDHTGLLALSNADGREAWFFPLRYVPLVRYSWLAADDEMVYLIVPARRWQHVLAAWFNLNFYT